MAAFGNGNEVQTVKKQVIHDDITFYTTRTEQPFSLVFELENNAFKVVTFVLDLSSSENVISKSEYGEDLKFEVSLQPYQGRVVIAKLELNDPVKKASIKTKKSWRVEDPPEEIIAEFQSQHEQELQKFLEIAIDLELDEDSASIAELTSRCQINEILFLDAEFPPNNSSLYKDHSGDEKRFGPVAFWRRPR